MSNLEKSNTGNQELISVLTGKDDSGQNSRTLAERLEQQLSNSIRLGCTAGAPIPIVRKVAETKEEILDRLNATGIYISPDSQESAEVIDGTERVMFHVFDPGKPDEYLTRCTQYVQRHGDIQVEAEESILGGPGMITVLSETSHVIPYLQSTSNFQNLLNFEQFLEHHKERSRTPESDEPIIIEGEVLLSMVGDDLHKILSQNEVNILFFSNKEELNIFVRLVNAYRQSSSDIKQLLFRGNGRKELEISSLRQILKQATVIEINNLGSCLEGTKREDWIQPLQLACKQGVIDGFIFTTAEDICLFREIWHEGDNTVSEPYLIFQSSPPEILRFFEEGHECDGYIATGVLSEESARQIWDTRIERIANAHKQPLFTKKDKRKIRIGVVALQGAYKQEKQLIESIQEEFGEELPYEIEVVLVHTREEMRNLDGVVLGGGWHGPQLELYNDSRLGIIQGIEEGIREGQDFFFSCAGAILARQAHKKSSGCSSHRPANLMDYAIENNYVNGRKQAEIKTNGKFQDLTGAFIGAPAFTKLGKRTSTIGRLKEDDTIIAVEQIEESGAILTATAAHNRSILLRWLNMIMKKRLDKVETKAFAIDNGGSKLDTY